VGLIEQAKTFMNNNANRIVANGRAIVLTMLFFYLGSKLTLPFEFFPNTAYGIYPSTGIALAAVLVWGYRVLPAIFAVALAVNYPLQNELPLFESPSHWLIAFASVLKAAIGAYLVKKNKYYPNPLISFKPIIAFFLCSGLIATCMPVALTVAVMCLSQGLDTTSSPIVFFSLWMGDFTGVIVFVPLFMIFFNRTHPIWRKRASQLGIPLVILFFIVLGGFVFLQQKEFKRLQHLSETQADHIKKTIQLKFDRQYHLLNWYHTNIANSKTPVIEGLRQSFLHSALIQEAAVKAIDWLPVGQDDKPLSVLQKYPASLDQAFLSSHMGQLKNAQALVKFDGSTLMVYLPDIATGPGSCLCLQSVLIVTLNSHEFFGEAANSTLGDGVSLTLAQGSKIYYQNGDPIKPLGRTKLQVLDNIQLGNLQLGMTLLFDVIALDADYFWFTWELLAGSMLLISFVSIGLLMLTGHNETIRLEVAKRTQELSTMYQKLKASEHQFRTLVQAQSAIVWRIDPTTKRFLFVSDEAVIMLGYPIDAWLNEPEFWQNHIHVDDKERAVAYCEAKTRNYLDHDFEYRMIAADGRCVWIREFVNLIIEKGVLTEIIGFMIDTSKQKLAEEQLRLAAITFESVQSVMITDKNAKILQVNKAFTEITGYAKAQVIGKNPRILQSGRHDGKFYKNLWHQLKLTGQFEGEIWNKRQNGEIYPEWKAITAVKDNLGEITHYVSVATDITDKKNAESKIYSMAFYDPLTALPNRRLLLDRFEQELAVAKRHGHFGAVIYFDLDYFKVLNDSLGHHVGDELLIQIANRLIAVIREEDTPARLGGDEFVVLLHANWTNLELATDQVFLIAEKIRQEINKVFFLGAYEHHISPSIGIALFPEQQGSPEVILQQADTAMYRSKEHGRNTINFFHPSMQEAADLRLKIEMDLRIACELSQFVLYYQPLFDGDLQLLGVEALIRWLRADGVLVSPNDFIPAAEESSCIEIIGQWVIDAACQQIKAWQESAIAVPYLSINISCRQFKQKNFVGQLQQSLVEYGIEPHRLGLELTENAMLGDIDTAVSKINAIKALGVSVAIDDFGTGYSSLTYLKQLPIDEIKIDRSFVRDLLTDSNDALVVGAIISLGRHLGIRTIAEGVECLEQLEMLKLQGCCAFQGHYFSLPMSADAFTYWYASNVQHSSVSKDTLC
jgi:diguanylate cyclase (GGDEF)-like protein/PAS domain S-box-containing protein